MMTHTLRALLCMLLVLVAPGVSLADTITLSWNANTEPDLAGYKLYQGTASGKYGAPITLGKVTTYTVTVPAPTANITYFFALSAIDLSSNESLLSNEASKTLTAPVAGVPVFVKSVTDAGGHVWGLTATNALYRDGAPFLMNGIPEDGSDLAVVNGLLYVKGTGTDTRWYGCGNPCTAWTVVPTLPTAAVDTVPPAAPTGLMVK